MNLQPEHIGLSLCQQAKALGITQSEIASATGINQSQISRIFDGKVKRNSKALERISRFLEMQPHGVTSDAVKSNSELIAALAVTWDGTSTHSAALATIIRALSVLKAQ